MAAFWTSRVCDPWRRCIFQTNAGRRCPGLSADRPGRLRVAWGTRCGSCAIVTRAGEHQRPRGRRPRRAVLILIFVEAEIAGAVGETSRSARVGSLATGQNDRHRATQTNDRIGCEGPIKLLYKQKIPSEPRTGAIPNHATPDRRSAKFMLSVIRKCCQSASEHAHATPNQITRNAGRRSPKEGPRVRRLTAGGRWIRTLGPPSAATPLSDRGVKPQAAASRLPLRRRDPPSGRP
jgi:hypothetical protein